MLSSNIKLEGFISLFISYWLPPMTMDTVLATIIAGGQARIRLNTEVSRNKLISTLNMESFIFFDGGIGTNMRKAAHPSDGMGSSNPCRWRGERLHHHGMVFGR
jgi:hypothetical protein